MMKTISNPEQVAQYVGTDLANFLFGIYDEVRIVDPGHKSVKELLKTRSGSGEPRLPCYVFWKKGGFCDNCTSLRALVKHREVSKLETSGTEVYLVHSFPLTMPDDRNLVLEVMKNLNLVEISSLRPEGDIVNHMDPDFAALLQSIDALNARLYQDYLTGALNREYLETEYPQRILEDTDCPLSVLLVDLDGFKAINDNFGHFAGDEVLRSFVATAKSTLRGEDKIVRWGGDEFVILLPKVSEEQALLVKQRLLRAVSEQPVNFEEQVIPYHLSIGAHTATQAGTNFYDAIAEADQDMYREKRARAGS